MSAYAELAVTTNFSFLRGASHAEELVRRAQELGLDGLGIADRNSVAGVVRAHVVAKDVGLKLAVGARLVFADGTPDILAYPQDRVAWGRLTRLLSRGKLRAEKGDCILRLPDLLEFIEGLNLIVMPGRFTSPHLRHLRGEVGSHAQARGIRVKGTIQEPERTGTPPHPARRFAARHPLPAGERELVSLLRRLKQAAPHAVWLAACRLYRGDDDRRLARLAEMASETFVPLIAVNDVLYHAPERRALQDVVTCIREHVTLDTARRRLEAHAERHLKAPEEMARLFRNAPEALAETLRLLACCRFSLDQLSADYPDEIHHGFATAQDALVAFAEQGARRRYPNGVPLKVRHALAQELNVIGELNYAPYFLTVHHIVQFARSLSQKILCQGRGSAANSVICYCLGITDVDPERIDLLFERFVSAERREPPDIDVDFEHERREEVIQYIYKTYGRERAGLAATVICYRGRSAIREVGKAFGLSEDAIGALAGALWGWSMDGVTEQEVRRAGLDPSDPRLSQVMKLAHELMGFPRHLSQHVGGFVITRSRLDEVVPIENAAMDDRTVVEWDKDDLNDLNILKVDVLGLGMLSCLRRAFDCLQAHYGVSRDLSIQDEDRAVYRMIQRADTIGVFQIESRAQMSMLPRLKPKEFYDLVIEVAIVRPGPIQGDMVHPYLRRRQGFEPVIYPSKELEGILHKTLGVPLFQEHVMRIAIVGAGFAPAEADRLRRAMATFKRVGTIETFRDKFIKGMMQRNYTRDFAERCFRQIEGFGEYGFPESHAASFANLVYASAWIKCRYPEVFAAALLNSQPMGFYAPAQIVRDAQEHGVDVRPVDVNFSGWDCALEPGPLAAERLERASIKYAQRRRALGGLPSPLWGGAGGGGRAMWRCTVESIALTPLPNPPPQEPAPGRAQARPGWGREQAQFAARPDSISPERALAPRHAEMKDDIRATHALRLGFRQISGFSEEHGRAIEATRGAGFDSVRDLWLRTRLKPAALERLAAADAFRSLGLDRRQALWAVRALQRTGDKDDLPLFAHVSMPELEPDVALPPMRPGEHVVEDYRHLHLSLKAHPVSFLRPDLDKRGIVRHAQLAAIPSGRRVTVAGLVLVRQRPGDAKAIFMTLEDETGIANTIIWLRTFEIYRPVVLAARLVSVTGKLQNEQGVIHVVADHLVDLSALFRRLSDDNGYVETLAHADAVVCGDDFKRPVIARGRHQGAAEALGTSRNGKPAFADEFDHAINPAAVMPKGRNFH